MSKASLLSIIQFPAANVASMVVVMLPLFGWQAATNQLVCEVIRWSNLFKCNRISNKNLDLITSTWFDLRKAFYYSYLNSYFGPLVLV